MLFEHIVDHWLYRTNPVH